MAKSRIKISGLKSLEKQFDNARGKSRSHEKKLGNDKNMIFSDVSLKIHKTNWDKFSDWLENNSDVKKIGQVEVSHVEKYIKELNEQGFSKKTLQTRISAINKVVGSRWNDDEKPSLQKMNVDVSRTDANSYKHLTAQEWKDRNEKRYETYRESFDTVSAFGLRKNELRELNKKSFLIDKNDKIYVQTIGKGGKYRIAECTSEKNDEMLEKYRNVATKIDEIDNFEVDKKLLERVISDNQMNLNLRGVRSNQNSWHIFRSEYAQTLLKEKIEVFDEELKGNYENNQGYTKIKVHQSNDEQLKKTHTQVGAYKGSALAFVEVSRNLGHNRLDVMLKYV